MKTLVIFDFDDTLFESHNHVILKKSDGQVKYLTTHEYASYVNTEGDELDFSQFDGYPSNPKPIESSVKKLQQAVKMHGLDNVIILTARSQSTPVDEVFHDFNLPPIYVAAVGSSDPTMKAEYAFMTVEEEGYDRVILFEDNIRNIVAIKNVLSPVIGPANILTYNVKQHEGSHKIVRH